MSRIRGVSCIIVVIFLLTVTIITASSVSAYKEKKDIKIEKIDEYLKEISRNRSSDANITVIIVLKEQPAHDISINVKKEYKQKFEDISRPAKQIYNRIKPSKDSELYLKTQSISEIINNEISLLTENEKDVLKEVGKNVDSKRREMRREILDRTIPQVDKVQKPLLAKIIAKGGSVRYSSKIYNAIVADVPISFLEDFAEEEDVYFIYPDNSFTASLDISTRSMGANISWWSNNLNGYAMDAAIIDTGIAMNHPDLSVDDKGVFHRKAYGTYGYDDNPLRQDDLLGHGTHVAGIVASTDTNYRGVGFGIDKLINAKAGWRGTDNKGHMFMSDGMEAIDWSIYGVADDADVISFSFNGPPNQYAVFEHFLDAISYSLDIPVVVSAGNGGPNPHTVGEPANAFNIIAVGEIFENDTPDRADDVIDSSSGRGPSYDERIKPDISAPGTDIMSTNNKWETEEKFISMSGTSMAAPHITGAVLLILDYMNTRWQPEAIKALLLNTAEDKGSAGPDNSYGYGYVDMSNAYLHRDDVFNGTVNNFPDGNVEKFYRGTVSQGDRATLVWNRHILYNGIGPYDPYSDMYASDLNLYMYNETNGFQISSSMSGVNNIEQVISSANHSSTILKVEPYGTYPSGITSEEYALATEDGFIEVTPPILNVNVSAEASANATNNFDLEVNVTNNGGISAHNVSVNITLPSGFSIVSGTNPLSLGSINNGSSNTASWVLRARVNTSSSYTLNVSAISLSYDESFSVSGNNTITVYGDGYINGTVRCNGTEIHEAFVTTDSGDSTITNLTGFYSIRVVPASNNLTVIHEPEHYPNSTIMVIAISGNTVIQDIELMEKPTGTISGEVRYI